MELVTATDTADVQNPEGAKDKRETGHRLAGRQRTLEDGNTLKPRESARGSTVERNRKVRFNARQSEGKSLKFRHKA